MLNPQVVWCFILLSSAIAPYQCLADDPLVSPEQMANWLNFNKPVELRCESAVGNIKRDFLANASNQFYYSNEQETLHSYIVAIYPKGKLFADKRDEIEKSIAQQGESMKNLYGQLKEKLETENPEMAKQFEAKSGFYGGMGVLEKPNEQKVFFTISGFGPGGSEAIAFTSLTDLPYDLLVVHMASLEDVPDDEKQFKNSPTPQTSFVKLFDRLEQAVTRQLKRKQKK